MRKYNEVKDVLDVERAQVLQGVLVFERDRFKFLIDSYSNVVKSEIILGETMSAQWAGLRDWGAALSMGLGVCHHFIQFTSEKTQFSYFLFQF